MLCAILAESGAALRIIWYASVLYTERRWFYGPLCCVFLRRCWQCRCNFRLLLQRWLACLQNCFSVAALMSHVMLHAASTFESHLAYVACFLIFPDVPFTNIQCCHIPWTLIFSIELITFCNLSIVTQTFSKFYIKCLTLFRLPYIIKLIVLQVHLA